MGIDHVPAIDMVTHSCSHDLSNAFKLALKYHGRVHISLSQLIKSIATYLFFCLFCTSIHQ